MIILSCEVSNFTWNFTCELYWNFMFFVCFDQFLEIFNVCVQSTDYFRNLKKSLIELICYLASCQSLLCAERMITVYHFRIRHVFEIPNKHNHLQFKIKIIIYKFIRLTQSDQHHCQLFEGDYSFLLIPIPW